MSLPRIIPVAALACAALLVAQNSPSDEHKYPPRPNVEILSDTQGVDFGPYLNGVINDVRSIWNNLNPHVPLNKPAEVAIEFDIMKDGSLKAMRLTKPSGNISLDRAAWGGITASQPFPPLPVEFTGQYLALRFHFYYDLSRENRREKASGQQNSDTAQLPVDVLSDTKGFNVRPYLDRMMQSIKAEWYSRIPEVARSPLKKKGRVSIEFHLMKDGNANEFRLVDTSGDASLDRAALAGVVAARPLAPLPPEFNCQYAVLRMHFYYNPTKGDVPNTNDSPTLPCVTTKITSVEAKGVTISPTSVQVAVGKTQQFFAFADDTNSAMTWKVVGSSCAGPNCGTVSRDGLYTAPLAVPNPPTITVVATSASVPAEAASATVTIVESGNPR